MRAPSTPSTVAATTFSASGSPPSASKRTSSSRRRSSSSFRIPADFDIDAYRGRAPWQIGDPVGEARIELAGDTAWWVIRSYGNAGRVENGAFVTEYSAIPLLTSWILRQD